jgi:hypothetical protein
MKIVRKIHVEKCLPNVEGWYDTNKDRLYWFKSKSAWSCREDRISEEYPMWWLDVNVDQKLLNQTSNDINYISYPEWLTEDIRIKVKETWNSHKDINDNLRIEAMRIIQKAATLAGYKINIKKATELLKQYCL